MKILLIDDDDDIRRIARLSLSRLGGMEVIEAASGHEGIETAERERPDAILLDVMMPELDGAETLSRLRRGERTGSIPVIFLTAKAMSAELSRLRRLGAAGVLTKPFNPATLAGEIRSLLEEV